MPSKTVFEVPGPRFNLKLSDWDVRLPAAHSRRVLCMALPPVSTQDMIVEHLHTALKWTVEELPFLAGSIVQVFSEKGDGWLRDIQGGGSAKLLVQNLSHALSYDDLKSRAFPQAALDHDLLCPFSMINNRQKEPVDVCRIQANFVAGGILLVVSIINAVCDGRAITDILKVFAGNLRHSQFGTNPPDPPSFYSVDRTELLNGHGVEGDIDRHAPWIVATPSTYSSLDSIVAHRQNVRIAGSDLPRLKADASVDLPEGTWISTHDAIVGLIWRSLVVARCKAGVVTSDDGPTTITQAVDTRKMMGLPHPYFGNAIYAINPEVTCADLADPEKGLTLAALTVRRAIQDVTPDLMRDFLGFIESTQKLTTLAVIQNLNAGGIFLTSHFKFGVCDQDFGPAFGKIDGCLMPTSSMLPGSPHILSKMPDGSCVILLNERQEVMQHLAEDKIFTKYASIVEGCR